MHSWLDFQDKALHVTCKEYQCDSFTAVVSTCEMKQAPELILLLFGSVIFFSLSYFPCVMRFYYRLRDFLSRKEISRRWQSRRCYHVGSLLVSSKTLISLWCHVVWLKPLEQWSWSEPLYGASLRSFSGDPGVSSFSGDPGVSSRQNVSLCFTGAVWRSAQKHVWQLVGCRICRITESDWSAFGPSLLIWRIYFSTPGSWIHSKSYPPCGRQKQFIRLVVEYERHPAT